MLRKHTDHDTCCTPTIRGLCHPKSFSTSQYSFWTLAYGFNPASEAEILWWQTEELPFPRSSRGWCKMSGFFLSHTHTPVICPISDLSPIYIHLVLHSGLSNTSWYRSNSCWTAPRSGLFCTWQWACFYVGWLINTPLKISVRFGGTQQARVRLFALWDYHKQLFI